MAAVEEAEEGSDHEEKAERGLRRRRTTRHQREETLSV